MKKWKIAVLTMGLLLGLAPAPAQAINVFDQCNENDKSKVCKASKEDTSATSTVKQIINLMLFALGIVAVIMIIWGGIKYVTSRGDAANVKSAKDTVTYAVIGLLVALFAYAIVNFVIKSFK